VDLTGFELVEMASRRKKIVRIAPMVKEARLTVSRWLLQQIKLKPDVRKVAIRRNGNVLALSVGTTSFVDNSYSKNKVRIQLPKDLFIPGKPFNCADVEIANGVVYIRVPTCTMQTQL